MEAVAISLKRGRPTKYTKETPKRVMHYIKKCQQSDDFPEIPIQIGILQAENCNWGRLPNDVMTYFSTLSLQEIAFYQACYA